MGRFEIKKLPFKKQKELLEGFFLAIASLKNL
jgi:hypothetical protein